MPRLAVGMLRLLNSTLFLFSSISYQLSHTILLFYFLLQLFETILHALVERTQVIGHSLSMKGDSPSK